MTEDPPAMLDSSSFRSNNERELNDVNPEELNERPLGLSDGGKVGEVSMESLPLSGG